MNELIKQEWLAELRKPENKQTKRRLKDDVGRCCLGVLCDIHAKHTGNEWTIDSNNCYVYLGANDVLPNEVSKWAEFKPENLFSARSNSKQGVQVPLDESTQQCYQYAKFVPLSALNDRDYTFPQIANLIEQYL